MPFDGLLSLAEELEDIIESVEKPVETLEVGAKEFVKDLMKLPRPMSKISKGAYTHLVNSFSYRIEGDQVVVGWGKQYGRMVEEGTRKSRRQPHLNPTFKRNQKKYYEEMNKSLGLN